MTNDIKSKIVMKFFQSFFGHNTSVFKYKPRTRNLRYTHIYQRIYCILQIYCKKKRLEPDYQICSKNILSVTKFTFFWAGNNRIACTPIHFLLATAFSTDAFESGVNKFPNRGCIPSRLKTCHTGLR